MKNEKGTEYKTRDAIMKLLTDDETARVSTAETEGHLPDGDEYLDMEHLDLGVRRAKGMKTPMGRVLSKKAVHADTWKAILAQLALAKTA